MNSKLRPKSKRQATSTAGAGAVVTGAVVIGASVVADVLLLLLLLPDLDPDLRQSTGDSCISIMPATRNSMLNFCPTMIE